MSGNTREVIEQLIDGAVDMDDAVAAIQKMILEARLDEFYMGVFGHTEYRMDAIAHTIQPGSFEEDRLAQLTKELEQL